MNQWEELWRGTSYDTTMHELLERTRRCTGIAMDVCGETMSYAHFHAATDAAAAWLQAQKLGPGATVIVSMKASCALFCMIAAVMKAGLVVTVAEDTIPEARLKSLWEKTGAQLRITDDMAERIFTEGKKLPLRSVTDSVSPDDVYAVWFTSGTTGEPCGILSTSRNTVLNIIPDPLNYVMQESLSACSAVLNLSHPSFGVGFTNFFYAIFYGKKFVHIAPGQSDTLANIAAKMEENPDCFPIFTPSAVSACLMDERVRRSLKNCSGIMVGADMVKPSLLADMRSVMRPDGKIVNLYGISDVGLVACQFVGPNPRLHAMGKATAGTQFSVVDENRKPLPQGEKGEFCISGLRVGPGYVGAAEKMQQRFVYRPDGTKSFYTGDYGYIDEDGEIYMLGRVDRIIKHLGFRVDPMEIEEAIKRNAGVRNVAVKQLEQNGRQVLCAFYENDRALDPEDIRAAIESALPRYSLPERFLFMEKLPLTERGKLDHRALVLPEGTEDARPYTPPETETERLVCQAFENFLPVGRVGCNDSFFELGGDSILAMQILSRLSGEIEIPLTVADLFHFPRPRELARHISAVRARETGNGAAADAAEEAAPRFSPGDELYALWQDENTEAIYPAEAASAFYLFLQENNTDMTQGGRMALRADCRRSYTEESFRERVRTLTARHPVLRSDFVRTADGKRWQVFRKRAEIPVYYRDLRTFSERARERFLSGFFQVMDEAGRPFQTGCFPVSDGECVILVYGRHAFLDGISGAILLRELAQAETPDGTDAFYRLRSHRYALREKPPAELLEHYRDFGEKIRLASTPVAGRAEIRSRVISLTAEQTAAVESCCAKEQVSLPTLVQYCYALGLLHAQGRDETWFSALFSGRSAELPNSESIVGNIFYTLPVRIRKDMTVRAFQEELLLPMRFPYITDTELYRALNRHQVEGGVISHVFPSLGDAVIRETDYLDERNTGHYMRVENGRLTVTLRHIDADAENKAYDIIEQTVRQRLKELT